MSDSTFSFECNVIYGRPLSKESLRNNSQGKNKKNELQ